MRNFAPYENFPLYGNTVKAHCFVEDENKLVFLSTQHSIQFIGCFPLALSCADKGSQAKTSYRLFLVCYVKCSKINFRRQRFLLCFTYIIAYQKEISAFCYLLRADIDFNCVF